MIIACDTSSVICSVAVSDQGSIVFEREATGGQIHIEKLSPFLEEAISFCESAKNPATGLAIAIGPGSFNGLRIGLATMKALAVVLELPLIPVFTTDALAYGIRQDVSGLSRAVVFSHRNFVHYANYDFDGGDRIHSPEFNYGPWEQLYDPEVKHYFGTADRGFADWLQTEAGNPVKNNFRNVHASATNVALLAESKRGEATLDLDELEPFYNAQFEAKKWVAPKF